MRALVSAIGFLVAVANCLGAAPAAGLDGTKEGGVSELPVQVGGWTRGQAERIEPEGLFAYMNGAGELYLGYRFGHLDVVEYTSEDEAPVVVELYWMASSDDAFGLLSCDWGGEPVRLGEGPSVGWPPRALYGAGLLRLWAGDLYARVLAGRETPASRAAVLAIGRELAVAHPVMEVPALAAALPVEVGDLALRREHVTFLRSYLVLNSVVFLASSDVLGLGPDTGATVARYDGGARAAWLIVVRYRDSGSADGGERAFRDAYLDGRQTDSVLVEDGWTAIVRRGPVLAVVLQGAGAEQARALAQQAIVAVLDKEERGE